MTQELVRKDPQEAMAAYGGFTVGQVELIKATICR